jgi:hypothetical protein
MDQGDLAGQVNMFEEADGPEADEAWRALVAKHPQATVIDDFMIALPSRDDPSPPEPEPEPEIETEPDLALKADPDPREPVDPGQHDTDSLPKQSSPDLAATPLSDPKTSSSKDDTETPKDHAAFEPNRSVVSSRRGDVHESDDRVDEVKEEATGDDAEVVPDVEQDSPRTSRQRLTAAQSEAAEQLAEHALRNAVIEIVADAEASRRDSSKVDAVILAADPVGSNSLAPAAGAVDSESLPPPLEKTTQAAWRRMARSYGVQQMKSQQMKLERRKMKKQGRKAVRPKSRRGNQSVDDATADIAAFEKWGFAPSLPQEKAPATAASAAAQGVGGQIPFAMPGKVGAWQENADHLLRDDANGYYTGPVSAAVSAVAIKRLRKARLDTAEVVGAALHVSSLVSLSL